MDSDFDRHRAMSHDELEAMQRRNWKLAKQQPEPSPWAIEAMRNVAYCPKPTMTLAEWDEARAAFRQGG